MERNVNAVTERKATGWHDHLADVVFDRKAGEIFCIATQSYPQNSTSCHILKQGKLAKKCGERLMISSREMA